jgi:hypothetical protein
MRETEREREREREMRKHDDERTEDLKNSIEKFNQTKRLSRKRKRKERWWCSPESSHHHRLSLTTSQVGLHEYRRTDCAPIASPASEGRKNKLIRQGVAKATSIL